MNDITIPGWAIGIMAGILIPWMIFLTRGFYKNQEAIAINTANDLKNNEELEKIYDKINESKKELQSSFDKLERKIDLFMVNEITLLKQMIPHSKQ